MIRGRILRTVAHLGFLVGIGILLSGCSTPQRSHHFIGKQKSHNVPIKPARLTLPQKHSVKNKPCDSGVLLASWNPGEEPGVVAPVKNQAVGKKPTLLLDLEAALHLATGNNLQIAFANEKIREAYARQDAAKTLWLPSISAGLSYNKHEGTLQASDGQVIEVSRSSLQTGAGTFAVGAGTPMVPGLAMKFHLKEALFEPHIAGQATAAQQQAATAVTNKTLLEVAVAYLEFLDAVQEEAIAKETSENAKQLAKLTTAFAKAGQGPQADADRAETELVIRQTALIRAKERADVAAARLVEILHLPHDTQLLPKEPTVVPLHLTTWQEHPHQLVATALTNRPELAESRHQVTKAILRLRQENTSPWLPSLLIGASYGGFGGSQGNGLDPYNDRFDLDAGLYWEVRNLGFGEQASRRTARSRLEQSRIREVQQMDRVARQVVQAMVKVKARQRRIEITQKGIRSAKGALKRDLKRIRQGQGLPLEAIESIRALDQARREYLRAVIDYNKAQFELQWAVGWLPQESKAQDG